MALSANVMRGGISGGTAAAIGGTKFAATTATGSVQGDAAAISSDVSTVAGADGTKGVILPAAQPGDSVVLFNNSASTLKVYPPTGAAITVNGTGLGSANAAFSHLTFKVATYTCLSSTQWYVNVSA